MPSKFWLHAGRGMDTPTADKIHHEVVVQLGREEVAPPHASRGMDTPKANEVHHEEVVQLNPKP